MSYVSKNPRFTTTSVTDSTTGTISSPPSGVDKIINRNGVLYLKNSAGGETPIGSSSGGKNYLAKQSDASAAVGTVSVVAAGGNITVSGTFPNVSSAWYADAGAAAIAISSDNTLRGTSNYLTALTSFSAAGAVYVQTPAFNIDGEDLGKALAVQFDVAGNTTADDWDVVAVRYTSAGVFGELIPVAGIASTTTGTASAQVPTGTTTFRGFFITSSTASDVYSIRWRRRAGAVAIRLDNLIVGPNSVMTGTAITDWISYTPTVTGQGTITLTYAQYRRVGSNLEVRAKWTAGTVDATSLTVSLPTGLNVSTSADALGTGGMVTSYAGAVQGGIFPLLSSSSTAAVYWTHNNSRSGLTALAGNGITQNSSVVTCTFEAPISTYSSNVTMADRAVEEYAWSTNPTTTAGNTQTADGLYSNGPSGTRFYSFASTTANSRTTKYVRFQTAIQATDLVTFEFSEDAGKSWYSASNGFISVSFAGTSIYGVNLVPVSGTTTDYYVQFGNKGYLQSNATYAGDGSAWSVIAGNANYLWRVRKVSGGAAVGFPVGARNVIGDTTGTAVPAGYIGEVITSSVTTATSVGTTGQFFNLTSITLTPGTYLINASAKYNRNSATFSSVDLEIGFSATTGNSSTGLVTGVNLIEKVQDVGLTFTQTPISMPTVYLRYDGTTATMQNGGTLTPTSGVFYLKGYCGVYSAATPQYYCTVTAVRIA